MIKMKDIKNNTVAELKKLLAEKRASLRAFKLGSTGSKTRNVKEGAASKKDIARILTVLNGHRGE
jgi:ribosomal protein L29